MRKLGKVSSGKERIIVPILGISVDSTSREGALIRAWRMGGRGRKPKLIVTPNPEIILSGYRDKSQARILNSADLALPDGVGVVMAMRYLNMKEIRGMGVFRPIALLFQGLWVGLSLFVSRKWLFEVSEVVPGRWLFEELVRKAAKEGKRVFLLGGRTGVAERAAVQIKKLKIKNKNDISKFKIIGESGPWLNLEGEPRDEEQKNLPAQAGIEKKAIQEINKFKPNFLFVGFGHPRQEKWLARNLSKLNVGVAMTIGGAFDYLAGEVPKPPEWLTQAGLEWLWRLLTQPWRIKRIFTAVVVFPFKLYLYRLGFPRL